VHSRHSKESSNNPVGKIIAFAEKVGVDFLCISDHDNHVDGDVAHHTWADPELKSNSVLLLYGAEWTTHRGHANSFSAKPYDHQRLYDVRDRRDVLIGKVKKELGLHLSANHPSNGDQFGFSYDLVDSIEVWNSAVWSRNANAIVVWDDMLKSGRKLTGRGGSDSHHGYPDRPELAGPTSWQAPANNVGTPTTWVFAKARTPQAVIDALTNGRVAVSSNPYAPRVEFSTDLDQDGDADMMTGDNVRSTGKPVTFRVQLAGNIPPKATYTVSVTKDGGRFGSFQATHPPPKAGPIIATRLKARPPPIRKPRNLPSAVGTWSDFPIRFSSIRSEFLTGQGVAGGVRLARPGGRKARMDSHNPAVYEARLALPTQRLRGLNHSLHPGFPNERHRDEIGRSFAGVPRLHSQRGTGGETQ
jgi:hypothetical protein